MNKVFTMSALALAVAGAVSANAATVTSTPVKLSKEGVAAGYEHTASSLTFDVSVTSTHAAGSTITLGFGDNISLGLAAAACTSGADGVVDNDPAVGTGMCTSTSSSGSGGQYGIKFDYGTGSFTFDNVSYDADANEVSFQVNLGNALSAASAFRVTLVDADGQITYTGAQNMTYSASLGGSVFETGSSALAVEESQFEFSLVGEFDALVDRTVEDQTAFTSGTDDELEFSYVDNGGSLNAEIPGATLTLVLESDFGADGADGFGGGVASTTTDGMQTAAVYTNLASSSSIIRYRTVGQTIPLNAMTYTATVVALDAAGDDLELAMGAGDAGQWELNASVVNVPYLPLGYGLTPNIEVANAGSEDAAISLEGFDDEGNVYPRTEISTIAIKHGVTKITEQEIQAAFGLSRNNPVKVNVTVVVDADAEDITLVPYYRDGSSRMGVITDQYKGGVR